MMTRGEVWLASFDPTVGREIQKTRPCLIVSPDEMNARLSTMTVLPLTSGNRPAPWRMAVRIRERDGLILCDQMRTLDRTRLIRRLGRVDDPTLRSVLATLREMFAD